MDRHFYRNVMLAYRGDVKLNSALWVMTENMLDLFSQYL